LMVKGGSGCGCVLFDIIRELEGFGV
jgi:hypothetical protein